MLCLGQILGVCIFSSEPSINFLVILPLDNYTFTFLICYQGSEVFGAEGENLDILAISEGFWHYKGH